MQAQLLKVLEKPCASQYTWLLPGWHSMPQYAASDNLNSAAHLVDTEVHLFTIFLCGCVWCICQVLLEVAASVQHLHNMQLLHCDIKPENVLLKSNNSNPLGFTTKLSDFGLAKLLRDNYYIINRSGSGTVTHLAPELFQVRRRSMQHVWLQDSSSAGPCFASPPVSCRVTRSAR
jgi:serine/threonine protein kinase